MIIYTETNFEGQLEAVLRMSRDELVDIYESYCRYVGSEEYSARMDDVIRDLYTQETDAARQDVAADIGLPLDEWTEPFGDGHGGSL